MPKIFIHYVNNQPEINCDESKCLRINRDGTCGAWKLKLTIRDSGVTCDSIDVED